MKSNRSEEKAPYVTKGSVFDDLDFTPAEALELKVKAEIYGELLNYIEEQGYSQKDLGKLLGILQPEVSNLLTGKVSRFSVGKLIKLAGKLNLGAKIKLTRPASLPPARVARESSKPRKHSTVA